MKGLIKELPIVKFNPLSAYYATLCWIMWRINYIYNPFHTRVYMMNYRKMSKNYVFREFECGLTIEETAQLCFKNVSTVNKWDKGQEIPKECKRLMRMHKRLELSYSEEWQGFKMHNNRLELPTGQQVTPQQILAGTGLLEINSELEIATSTHLIKIARVLGRIKNR